MLPNKIFQLTVEAVNPESPQKKSWGNAWPSLFSLRRITMNPLQLLVLGPDWSQISRKVIWDSHLLSWPHVRGTFGTFLWDHGDPKDCILQRQIQLPRLCLCTLVTTYKLFWPAGSCGLLRTILHASLELPRLCLVRAWAQSGAGVGQRNIAGRFQCLSLLISTSAQSLVT